MNIDFASQAIQAHVDAVRAVVCARALRCFVVTLGCQQNEADGEHIRGMAQAMGYLPAECAEDASLIVVNTCAIREHAELKALSLIGRFKHIKQAHPETVIALCGCMAAQEGVVRTIKEKFPYVSFTLQPNMLHRFPELLHRALTEGRRSFLLGEDVGDIAEGLPTVRRVRHRAWVSIMYGCNNFCSYCIVPYVRGRERSRDAQAVIDECRALIADGCREITLLGQNVNSYKSTMTFAALLEHIAQLDGDFRVRFMTSHPKDVSDELIAVMACHRDKIAPAFHLPLQSGSDRILKAMHRTYTRERYLSIVHALREAIPDIALTTDIIVAFPGESDEDFEDTYRLVEQVGYDSLFSFIFSPREGTRAATLPQTTPDATVKERMARLIALSQRTALEKNQAYVGRCVRVLCDGPARDGDGLYIGRTDSGKLVCFPCVCDKTGEFVYVRINKATPFDLFGAIDAEASTARSSCMYQ